MPGLYEVRVNGIEIFYTDEQGNYLLQGNLIDVKARRNLTEERVEKLSEVDFDKLPLKDAFKIVRGNGKRKLAVFEDPNCGYCKQFERDLQKVDNVTIHLFLTRCWAPTRPTSRATSGAPRTRPRPGATGWCAASSRADAADCDTARAHAQRRVRPEVQHHRHAHADLQPTARACRARSRPPQVEKQLAAAK